jgi:antirestriction protein ArdC
VSAELQPPSFELDTSKEIHWSELIEQALNVPGSLGNTYNRFYNYSIFNCYLLYLQGVSEPVATYKRWLELGRQVQKGSRARTIMMPLFFKAKNDDGETVQKLRGFKYKACLFPVSETEGEELPPYVPAEWSPDKALESLDITEVPFTLIDGNTAGYSFGRKLAINPVAAYPLKTMAHELAHIVLGHTQPDFHQEYAQHRGLAEFQAEATAYLVMNELECLDQMNAPESRAYIQTWLRGEKPDDAAIRKVFGATETILKAGRTQL